MSSRQAAGAEGSGPSLSPLSLHPACRCTRNIISSSLPPATEGATPPHPPAPPLPRTCALAPTHNACVAVCARPLPHCPTHFSSLGIFPSSPLPKTPPTKPHLMVLVLCHLPTHFFFLSSSMQRKTPSSSISSSRYLTSRRLELVGCSRGQDRRWLWAAGQRGGGWRGGERQGATEGATATTCKGAGGGGQGHRIAQ